jgi:chorismate mutase
MGQARQHQEIKHAQHEPGGFIVSMLNQVAGMQFLWVFFSYKKCFSLFIHVYYTRITKWIGRIYVKNLQKDRVHLLVVK